MSETDRYVRINRNNLIADTNLVEKGSVTSAITNPSSGTLWSRVGGRTTEYSAPFPGYCLRFNKSNQFVYIQTSIPSSERDNYKIIIKGEGTIDHLYVDTSAANIAIKQASAITDSSYFDLSYIAFVNKTTGDIDHLFECEETNGTLLYDAVRGGTASLESVTSISAIRVYTNKYKEWIADYSNLDDKVQCFGGANAGLLVTKKDANTNLTPLRNENIRSYCLTLEVKQDFSVTNFNSGITLIGDFVNGGTNKIYGNHFFLYKNSAFGCQFGVGSKGVSYEATFNKLLTGRDNWGIKIIPAGIYKLCLIVNVAEDAANSYFKTYCNGVNTWTVMSLNATNKVVDTSTIKYGTETDTMDTFRVLSQQGSNYQPNYNLPCQISNVRVFGFDVSSEGAAYTVEDYTNDRQIDNPSTFPGVLLYYDNLSYWTNLSYANCYRWLDRGPKNAQLCVMNNGANARNRMECPCKNYGTWLNNAGWSKTSGSSVYIPRAIAGGGTVFELNSSMQFEHSWTWATGTGKVEGYFEDDGTLVCKVSEEVTLSNAFSLPDLKLVGGITPNIIKDKLVRVTWENIYINPDIYFIGSGSNSSYGKTIIVGGLAPIKSDWYTQPNEIIYRVVSASGYPYLGTNNFYLTPYSERSKDGSLLTIPVGTILWKVKGLKLELIS